MSAKEKTNKKITRREFLKDAGLIAGGAALGSMALVNACGGTTTQTVTQTTTKTTTAQGANVTITKQGETSTFSASPVTTRITTTAPPSTVTVTSASPTKTVTATMPKSGYIQWKADQCMACSRCVMACSVAKEGAISSQFSAIQWEEAKEFAGFQTRAPLFCQQCSQPECYFACPLKDQAFCIDAKTGARYIVKDKCSGCGFCVQACPFEVPRISLDNEKKKAIKCDLCKDRADGPVCVGVCDRLALSVVKAETRL